MKSKKRPRETFGVRINPEIKTLFLDAIKQKKLNSCHILEALMVAWVEGTKKRPRDLGLAVGSTLTINQKFENVVARSRREIKGGVKQYKPEYNCYSKKAGGIWGFRRIDSPSDVNKFGHHISCECLDCSGRRANFL